MKQQKKCRGCGAEIPTTNPSDVCEFCLLVITEGEGD